MVDQRENGMTSSKANEHNTCRWCSDTTMSALMFGFCSQKCKDESEADDGCLSAAPVAEKVDPDTTVTCPCTEVIEAGGPVVRGRDGNLYCSGFCAQKGLDKPGLDLFTKAAPKLAGTKHDTLKPRYHLVPLEAWPAHEMWGVDTMQSFSWVRSFLHEWSNVGSGTSMGGLRECIVTLAYAMCHPAPAPAMLLEVARVLAFGANKYAKNNWRKGFKWTRLSDGAERHLAAYDRGEVSDPETGLPHLAHATCNLLFLITHIQDGLGEDDR